jgi:hypothetical protein
MYHGDTCLSLYKITQEQCKFRDASIKFSHDTSSVDWKNIPDSLTKNLICAENLTITKESYVVNYEYSNQNYAFESLFIFIIQRNKCGKTETMKISFPVIISSFVTFIDLGKIYFVPGEFYLTDELNYSLTQNDYLKITLPENTLPDYLK